MIRNNNNNNTYVNEYITYCIYIMTLKFFMNILKIKSDSFLLSYIRKMI